MTRDTAYDNYKTTDTSSDTAERYFAAVNNIAAYIEGSLKESGACGDPKASMIDVFQSLIDHEKLGYMDKRVLEAAFLHIYKTVPFLQDKLDIHIGKIAYSAAEDEAENDNNI
jgi:hypothetical protein